MLGASNALQNASAEGDTRTLSFHHLHTKENITVTFKRNGRYDEAALKQLNWFMRDWRKNEDVRMDPHLFDLMWETYRAVGGSQAIHVICGYRSSGTNAMLRARSTGVAETSQHTAGHAIDFAIPGVPLEKIREVGLRLQRGGVGFYPTSGSPFVHMDTGSIRHWPRMTYAQLMKVFPDGRTVHVSAEGRPLPGYSLALAEVEKQGNAPNRVSLAAARGAGAIDEAQEREAENTGRNPQGNLLASLFGMGKKNADETPADEALAAAPKKSKLPATAVASLTPPKQVATERVVPLPTVRPAIAVAAAPAAPQAVTASLSARAETPAAPGVIEQRGWPSADPTTQPPFQVADATETQALAYASADGVIPLPTARTRPMGKAAAAPAPVLARNTTVAGKSPAPELIFGGQRLDSPWLRATAMAPSIWSMSVAQFGAFDMRMLAGLMAKPQAALTLGFSADPAAGLSTARFSGSAVAFQPTATFGLTHTASLR